MNQAAAKDAERVIELPAGSFSRAEDRALPAIAPSAGNAGSLLQAIERVASNPAMDIDKVERLFAMHQQLKAKEAEAAFNDAMAKAQSEIQPVVNNATNDHTRSSYAKLEQIDRAITPVHTKFGLSVSYDTETKNDADPVPIGMLRTVAIVAHSAGHSRRYHIDLPPDDAGSQGKVNKTGVQARGSTNAYARRYLKLGIFNVSTFDDKDGNKQREREEVEPDAEGKKALEACGSMAAFAKAWNALSKEQRKTLHEVRAECEARIKEADGVAG